MLETHPFGSFVPQKARYLLVGSFTGRDSGNWFYGTVRNQFWPILEEVYGWRLVERKEREGLFDKLGLAVTDVIYQCERKRGSNLDNNLINIVYNEEVIRGILRDKSIERIYFSSRFVEKLFGKLFKDVSLETVTLPSPSPRYAAMSKAKKVERYRELMPVLESVR